MHAELDAQGTELKTERAAEYGTEYIGYRTESGIEYRQGTELEARVRNWKLVEAG